MSVLIFYYAQFGPWGGLETVVLSLASTLIRSGCRVGLVEMGPRWQSRQVLADGIPLWTLAGPSFPTLRRPRSWAALARAVWQFQKIIREFKPDIVNVHFPLGQSLPVVGASLLPHRWRLVVTVHGSDIRVSPFAEPRLRAWQNRLFERSDAVTAVSQSLLTDTVRLYPRISTKAKAIYSGVGTEWFSREGGGLAPAQGKKYVLFVGALRDAKGIDVLLHAWAKVSPRASGTELWLVGTGRDREALECLAKRLGVSSSVRFLAHKNPEELRTLYCQAELFVLPSRHEGLGLVLLEAGACGAICIGTRVGGIKEAIEDEVTGFLVEPQSPDALARAILRVLDLPAEEKDRIRQAAQTRIRKNFTQEIMSSKYLGLFQNLLDRQVGDYGNGQSA